MNEIYHYLNDLDRSKDELRFILLYLVLGWTGCISMWANDHFSVIFKTA